MWCKKVFFGAIFIILCSHLASSAKILIVDTSPSRSHVITVQAAVKVLADRGHAVTSVTSFPLNKKDANYREIPVKIDEMDFVKDSVKTPGILSTLLNIFEMTKILSKIGSDTFQSKELQTLMKEENFDLVIVGYVFNEFFLGLGDHFKCPSILVSPHGMMSPMALMMGNPLGVPASQHLIFTTGNDFLSRVATFLIYGIDIAIYKMALEPASRKIYE